MMSEPTLYRIDVLADTGGSLEPGAWAQIQVDLLKQRGVLVPVEPDSIITTDGKVPVFVGLEAGTYLLFECPGVGIGDNDADI